MVLDETYYQGSEHCPRWMLDNVPNDNNLVPLRHLMGDLVDYWVTNQENLFTIKFPVKVDRYGPFSHLDSCFNLPSCKYIMRSSVHS